MGSLKNGNGGPPPLTDLPLFNTTTTAAKVSSYHHVTQHVSCFQNGNASIIKRFAQFVASVVGGNSVTFVANTDNGLDLVYASVAKSGVVTTTLQRSDPESKTSRLGFAITTVDSRNDQLQQPFILSVQCHGGSAIFKASLRGSHGPEEAAQHLLRLAISYLSPEMGLEKTSKSVILAPVLVPEASASNPSPALLHDVLGHAAGRFSHRVAIEEVTGKQGGIYTRKMHTYAQLQEKVSVLADEIDLLLQKLDWPAFRGQQRMVPIWMPNSMELNISMNAISKTGHAFCPLQLDAPETRIRGLLEDLRAPGILGVGSNPWAGTPFGEEIIWIDYSNIKACLTDHQRRLGGTNLPRRLASPEDIAYVMYTSGSSGRPKGVLVPHSAALSFLEAIDGGPAPLPVGPDFRWMVMSAPTFDIVLMDNFMAFRKGGTVCIAERGLLLTQPEAVINELRATATFTVTSLAMLLRPEKVHTLSWLSVGGEMLGQRIVDNFAPKSQAAGQNSSHCQLICGYGPTEATVFTTVNVCDKNSRPSIIGQPLPNFKLVVLDMDSPEELRAVPFGVPGELAVSGPQLAPGYLNRPEETARAFIEGGKEFGRLYRTGDKVRVVWTDDGQPRIEYLGRLSTDQVKLNGRRVDLPEIENVLSQCDGVARATALVSKSKLIACIMPWEDTDLAGIESRCHAEVSNQLPAYMRPTQYFIMQKLPLSANGKVDRRGLSAIVESEHIQAITTENQASTKSENTRNALISISDQVRSILALILGDEVHAQPDTASLQQLGLDSLCVLVFLKHLSESGIEPPHLHDVLSAGTIRDLITVIEDSRTQPFPPDIVNPLVNPKPTVLGPQAARSSLSVDGIDVSTIAVDDDERVYEMSVDAKLRHFEYHLRPKCLAALELRDDQVDQVLPTTNVQARFVGNAIDTDLYDPANIIGRPQIQHFPYNIPMRDVDPARLQRAIEAVLPRHDCFRAVFLPVEHPLAPFAQCILSPSAARIPKTEVICDDTNAESRDSLWIHTVNGIQRAAESYMSIDKPGVAMGWVWSPTRARCTMIMTLFHGIFDGTQLNYLWDAILAEYESPGSPTMELLPMRRAVEFTLGYDWIETGMYWTRRLGGIPRFCLGQRKPIPRALAPNSFSGFDETHMRACGIKASMTLRQLKKAAQAMSVSMLSVAEAAWASVLAQTLTDDARAAARTGKQSIDMQWATVLNGRVHHDALRCMAPMMAAVPQVLFFNGAKPITNREACAALSSLRQEAQAHIQMPCPSMEHYRLGCNRFDSVLLLQALAPDGADTLRGLPGFNLDEHYMPPFKEIDIGYPVTMEIWPGKLKWDEKMLLRCICSIRQYKFLTSEWMHATLSAFDEALVRVTSAPDEIFYIG